MDGAIKNLRRSTDYIKSTAASGSLTIGDYAVFNGRAAVFDQNPAAHVVVAIHNVYTIDYRVGSLQTMKIKCVGAPLQVYFTVLRTILRHQDYIVTFEIQVGIPNTGIASVFDNNCIAGTRRENSSLDIQVLTWHPESPGEYETSEQQTGYQDNKFSHLHLLWLNASI